MTIAFDLDDTITIYPHQCEVIASSLMQAGHKVIIISGAEIPNPTHEQACETRRAKLELAKTKGFTSCNGIEVAFVRNSDEAAQYKAGYCKGEGVDILIDDSLKYCETVKRACPGLLVLRVMPR